MKTPSTLHRWRSLLNPLLAFVAALPLAAAPRESDPPLPNVLGAVNQLNPYGDFLAFHSGNFAPLAGQNIVQESSRTTHFQGIARTTRLGVPYLFVTRSGMADGDAANLLVVQMTSRPKHGERLRSNRLVKGLKTWQTPPPLVDRAVRSLRFDGWHHVGGIALCGDILAIPLEGSYGAGLPTGRIVFYDVSDPVSPQPLALTIDFTSTCGVVGMTRLPDGHFLLVMTMGDGSELKFFRSTGTSFLEPGFGFVQKYRWTGGELKPSGGSFDWPTGTPSYQGLSLLTQSDGAVFLVGGRNTSSGSPVANGDDMLGVYRVTGWEEGSAKIEVTRVQSERHFYCSSEGGQLLGAVRAGTANVNASFLAGVGTYVSPTGDLLLYAVEHWNDGPQRSVRFVEFHNERLHIANLTGADPATVPPLKPVPIVAVPDSVVEGSRTVLDGSASVGRVIKPWIELFEDDTFQGRSVRLEWDDRKLEDYQDFRQLDGPPSLVVKGFNDRASSARWQLPEGWMATLYNEDNFGTSESLVNIIGNGALQSALDFKSLNQPHVVGPSSFGDKTTSMQIVRLAGLDPDAPPTFLWSIEAGSLPGTRIENPASPTPTLVAGIGSGVAIVKLVLGPAPTTQRIYEIPIIDKPLTLTAIAIEDPSKVPGQILLTGQIQDPGSAEPHTLSIDWGDRGPRETVHLPVGETGFKVKHTYADDQPIQPLEEEFILSITASNGNQTARHRVIVRTVWRIIAPGSDIDHDGLPDTWEVGQLGGLGQGAGDDYDRDGATNLDEFLAGTDPTRSDESFGAELALASKTSVRLTFYGRRSIGVDYGGRKRVYVIQSADVLGGAWKTRREVTGLDAEESFEMPVEPNRAGFLRVFPELR